MHELYVCSCGEGGGWSIDTSVNIADGAKCCEYSEQFDYMFVPDKGWSFKYSCSCN